MGVQCDFASVEHDLLIPTAKVWIREPLQVIFFVHPLHVHLPERLVQEGVVFSLDKHIMRMRYGDYIASRNAEIVRAAW